MKKAIGKIMNKEKFKDVDETTDILGSTRPQCRADEPITSATHPECKFLKEDNDQRFIRIFRETLENIPKNVLKEFEKKKVRCFLSLLPLYDDRGRKLTKLGHAVDNERDKDELIFSSEHVNLLSDEALRGLIASYIAYVYLGGHCDDEEVVGLTARWGFTGWLQAWDIESKAIEEEQKTMNQI